MKINPLQDAALAAAAGAAKPGRSPAAPVAGAEPVAGTLSVSATARTLEAATVAGSGIDEAKVAAVRAAIADGSFKVDAGAVADKLLANAQEFLVRARS